MDDRNEWWERESGKSMLAARDDDDDDDDDIYMCVSLLKILLGIKQPTRVDMP